MNHETSLIFVLNKEIRERGYLSFQEMENICRRENKKPSNGERRLRKSESPNVESVMNDKGAITGYRYKSATLGEATTEVKTVVKEKVGLFPYPKFNESASRWRL